MHQSSAFEQGALHGKGVKPELGWSENRDIHIPEKTHEER